MLSDFPKLECPFIRESIPIDKALFKVHREEYRLRKPELYLVKNQINPGYEWVFEDPDTFAVEKLDGTNVKLKIDGGHLVALQNRKNIINPLKVVAGNTQIIEAVFMAIQKGYIKDDGEFCGEVIGPKLQGNPYQMLTHIWYPFERAISQLRYKSFDNHGRTFENWNVWFKEYLVSLYHTKIVGRDKADLAEGVIFYNLKRRDKGLTYMAKLRRDMFDWHYPKITQAN